MTAPKLTLTTERPGQVQLANHRTMSYAALGDPDATDVVMVLDGPGSRGLARAAAVAAETAGICLIAPDRPGCYASTPVGEPSFSGVAGDLLALADALSIERFGVLGQSGGTTYALAVAALAPERVHHMTFTGAIS